ncbi:Rhodanese-like protein [Hesseltinella vesiculosa]|uniref:Rhodanese-like protein n=1 Tax=Hesseltinella vesiculosa TaxID=101127 RepID=A0A1X2GQZ9_9FUNG|nr:Rhodanese-like protein [Hesseltinella vesiculosa]
MVGRIYISKEGINAQVSCPAASVAELRRYCQTKIAPLVGGSLMDLNIATEGDHPAFRALHVRIRKQLVADGLDPTSYDLADTPSHLSPQDWHDHLSQYKEKHGKDPVLIDMRNHYESNIGYFEGAICPDADTFRDSIQAMNDICKDLPKDQDIYMYCTGGIRCSKAGAILQSQQGFKNVHLVEGGITAYGRWLRDQQGLESLFRGKNFTFDARMGEAITEEITGTHCMICGSPCNRYQNCAHAQCNLLMICCSKCASRFLNTCARLDCYDTISDFLQSQPAASPEPSARTPAPQAPFYDAAGPLFTDSGVRAYVKHGKDIEDHKKHARVVVGTSGKACEHEFSRRTRALEVLGQPGDVLKAWAEAGRCLPPLPHSNK